VAEEIEIELDNAYEDGRESGVEEGQIKAYAAVAKHLLSRGMTLDMVADYTNISVDKVKDLCVRESED
ncbi:MAG TPA: hypothetical protein DCY94_01770, partial [Firmicutes bacterium]|nr:hypothetical protein [Bacillota bacterium]